MSGFGLDLFDLLEVENVYANIQDSRVLDSTTNERHITESTNVNLEQSAGINDGLNEGSSILRGLFLEFPETFSNSAPVKKKSNEDDANPSPKKTELTSFPLNQSSLVNPEEYFFEQLLRPHSESTTISDAINLNHNGNDDVEMAVNELSTSKRVSGAGGSELFDHTKNSRMIQNIISSHDQISPQRDYLKQHNISAEHGIVDSVPHISYLGTDGQYDAGTDTPGDDVVLEDDTDIGASDTGVYHKDDADTFLEALAKENSLKRVEISFRQKDDEEEEDWYTDYDEDWSTESNLAVSSESERESDSSEEHAISSGEEYEENCSERKYQCSSRKVPEECSFERIPDECGSGKVPDECGSGKVPDECSSGKVPDECGSGKVPDECSSGKVPFDCSSENSEKPADKADSDEVADKCNFEKEADDFSFDEDEDEVSFLSEDSCEILDQSLLGENKDNSNSKNTESNTKLSNPCPRNKDCLDKLAKYLLPVLRTARSLKHLINNFKLTEAAMSRMEENTIATCFIISDSMINELRYYAIETKESLKQLERDQLCLKYFIEKNEVISPLDKDLTCRMIRFCPPYFKYTSGDCGMMTGPSLCLNEREKEGDIVWNSPIWNQHHKKRYTAKERQHLESIIKSVLLNTCFFKLKSQFELHLISAGLTNSEIMDFYEFQRRSGLSQSIALSKFKTGLKFKASRKSAKREPWRDVNLTVARSIDNSIVAKVNCDVVALCESKTKEENSLLRMSLEDLLCYTGGRVDWLAVARQWTTKKRRARSAEELEWEFHSIRNVISQAKWTIDEELMLRNIVQTEIYEKRGNWHTVSAMLGTNRSPFSCFKKYVQLMRPRKGLYVANDTDLRKRMLALMKKFGSNPIVIQDNLLKDYGSIRPRDIKQTCHRVLNPLFKKGKFSILEDTLLLIEVFLHCPEPTPKLNFTFLQSSLPWRHCSVWRQRYFSLLKPVQLSWTKSEEIQLLKLIRARGLDWRHIAPDLGSFKTAKQCRSHFLYLRNILKYLSLQEYHRTKDPKITMVSKIDRLKQILVVLCNYGTKFCVEETPDTNEVFADKMIVRMFKTLSSRNIAKVVKILSEKIKLRQKLKERLETLLSAHNDERCCHCNGTCGEKLKVKYRSNVLDRRKFDVSDAMSVASALQIRGVELKDPQEIYSMPRFLINVYRLYQYFIMKGPMKKTVKRPGIPSELELRGMPEFNDIIKPLESCSVTSGPTRPITASLEASEDTLSPNKRDDYSHEYAEKIVPATPKRRKLTKAEQLERAKPGPVKLLVLNNTNKRMYKKSLIKQMRREAIKKRWENKNKS